MEHGVYAGGALHAGEPVNPQQQKELLKSLVALVSYLSPWRDGGQGSSSHSLLVRHCVHLGLMFVFQMHLTLAV